MKKQTEDKNYEIKFWKDWLNANLLEREKLVEKLPIVKNIWGMVKLPEKPRKQCFVSMLNGFFEDLESAVYTKIRIENKKVLKNKGIRKQDNKRE